MKILVIAAHPDDEILGCGGTIARLVSQGERVSVVILGEGITSRYKTREEAPRSELETLASQAKEATKLLGVGASSLESKIQRLLRFRFWLEQEQLKMMAAFLESLPAKRYLFGE